MPPLAPPLLSCAEIKAIIFVVNIDQLRKVLVSILSGQSKSFRRKVDSSLAQRFGCAMLGEFNHGHGRRTIHGWRRDLRCGRFYTISGIEFTYRCFRVGYIFICVYFISLIKNVMHLFKNLMQGFFPIFLIKLVGRSSLTKNIPKTSGWYIES